MSDSDSEITPGRQTDPANPLTPDQEAELDLDTSSENITSDSVPENVQAQLVDHTEPPPPDDEPEIDLETLGEAEKKAVQLTKQANSGAAHFKPLGLYEQSLGGTLVFVGFDWDGVPDDECVFIDAKKNATILSAEQLSRRITTFFPSTFWRLVSSPASFSGFIALIITFTISFIVLRADSDELPLNVPPVLSGPLAVIVGFYFGRYAFTSISPIRDAAIKQVASFDPSAKNIRVKSVVTNFLSGDLVIVGYENATTKNWESYVYLTPEGAQVYEDKQSLGELAQSYRAPSWWQVITSVTTFGGFIALVICLTLCLLVIMKPEEPDPVPVLGSSLTTILAFYFGTQAAKP